MNETLKTIHSRRTTHGDFGARELRAEDIRTILEASVCAPTASAQQSYSIVVLDDRATMRKVCSYEASRVFVYCVDYTRLIDEARYLGTNYDVEDTIGFVTGAVDTVLAVQSAVLAAESLGIQTLVTNGIHRRDAAGLDSLLGLPERHCFPIIALVLGYAEKAPDSPQRGRLCGKGVVHYGRYQRLSDAELGDLVREYDDVAKHVGMIDDWKAQGCDHYLTWFFDKWCKGFGESDLHVQFRDKLRGAGFIA